MKVNQIYEILNTIQEILGKTGLVNEDLSNIVDLGMKMEYIFIQYQNNKERVK